MQQFVRALLLSVYLGSAAPAQAAMFTLDLEGTADLSFFGASSSSSFDASVRWDTTAAPLRIDDHGSAGTVSYFAPLSWSFSVNELDLTDVIPYTSLLVVDEPNAAVFNRDHLVVEFAMPSPYPALGSGPGRLSLVEMQLSGVPTMFDSPAIPGDPSFIDQVSAPHISFFSTYPSGNDPYYLNFEGQFTSITGSVTSTSVPEPTAGMLTALGLIGLIARHRRRRSSGD